MKGKKIIRESVVIAIVYFLIIIAFGFEGFPSLKQEYELNQRIPTSNAMLFVSIDKAYYLMFGILLSLIITCKDLLIEKLIIIRTINIFIFLSIIFCLYSYSKLLFYH